MQEVGLLSLTSEPRDALVMLVLMAVSDARGSFIVNDNKPQDDVVMLVSIRLHII